MPRLTHGPVVCVIGLSSMMVSMSRPLYAVGPGYRAGTRENSVTLGRGDSTSGSWGPTSTPPVVRTPGASRGRSGGVTPPLFKGPAGGTRLGGGAGRGNNRAGRTSQIGSVPRRVNRTLRGGNGGRSALAALGSNPRRARTGNWTLGGDRPRPVANNSLRRNLATGRQIINRADRTIYELLKRRELARQRFEHGGGFARDREEFVQSQQGIESFQQERLAAVLADTASQADRDQEIARALSVYGLNQSKFQGLQDAWWPGQEGDVTNWLNDPNSQP